MPRALALRPRVQIPEPSVRALGPAGLIARPLSTGRWPWLISQRSCANKQICIGLYIISTIAEILQGKTTIKELLARISDQLQRVTQCWKGGSHPVKYLSSTALGPNTMFMSNPFPTTPLVFTSTVHTSHYPKPSLPDRPSTPEKSHSSSQPARARSPPAGSAQAPRSPPGTAEPSAPAPAPS